MPFHPQFSFSGCASSFFSSDIRFLNLSFLWISHEVVGSVVLYGVRHASASPRVCSTSPNDCYCLAMHILSAYRKLLVLRLTGWSFVYMLNNRGSSTLPCGRPFFCLRHLLCLPTRSIKKRLLDNMFWISSVRLTSCVISNIFLVRILCFTA